MPLRVFTIACFHGLLCPHACHRTDLYVRCVHRLRWHALLLHAFAAIDCDRSVMTALLQHSSPLGAGLLCAAAQAVGVPAWDGIALCVTRLVCGAAPVSTECPVCPAFTEGLVELLAGDQVTLGRIASGLARLFLLTLGTARQRLRCMAVVLDEVLLLAEVCEW